MGSGQDKYLAKHNAFFDQLDLVTYEEVCFVSFLEVEFCISKKRITLLEYEVQNAEICCPLLLTTNMNSLEGCEAACVQEKDAGAAGRARRGSAAHQEQPDRGAQGEVRVPHPAHDAGAAEGRGERKELLLRLAGRDDP